MSGREPLPPSSLTSPPLPDLLRPPGRRPWLWPRWVGWTALVAVVCVLWGIWWVTHEHLLASLRFGFLDASVSWSISRHSLQYGGETEVSLRDRWHLKGEALADLVKLHRVVALDLQGCPEVTDNDLSILRDLPHLRVLRIGRPLDDWYTKSFVTRRGDSGLADVAALKNLEELDLTGLDVTDAGLAHLAGLTKLRSLYLGHTKVTDAGLLHLKGLRYLEYLDVEETAVTPAGTGALLEEQPTLMIQETPPNEGRDR